MKKSVDLKNLQISHEYQNELNKIREEAKKGECSTFKEYLGLFEELWKENHPENLLFSNKTRKIIGK